MIYFKTKVRFIYTSILCLIILQQFGCTLKKYKTLDDTFLINHVFKRDMILDRNNIIRKYI
jgi:hypothetical protein